MKKIRILSLDGGGIRGILPGTILTYLEDQIQKITGNDSASIGEYFDLIAGTSTGGILSLIYLSTDDNGGYRFTAKEALNIYLKKGDDIFNVKFGKKLKSLGGLRDEKYSEDVIEKTLLDYFGDLKLNQTLKPCLITSYDIHNRKAHFFSSLDAESEVYNYYLRDVARATSAAPTYFEPAKITSMYGTPKSLVDGGLFANNPALCAYSEARNIDFSKALNDNEKPNKPSAKNMLIVSIGTGEVKTPYKFDEFENAGMVKWIKPIIDIMMSGNSETVNYQLRQIYNTLEYKDSLDYYRLQTQLIHAESAMDQASPKNLKALHDDGLAAVEHYKTELDDIANKLIAHHNESHNFKS